MTHPTAERPSSAPPAPPRPRHPLSRLKVVRDALKYARRAALRGGDEDLVRALDRALYEADRLRGPLGGEQ